jgi:hypothetical protein
MFDNTILTEMFIFVAVLFLLFSILSAVIIYKVVKTERSKNIDNLRLIVTIYDQIKDEEVARYVNNSVRNFKAGASLNLQTEMYLTNTKRHFQEITNMLSEGATTSAELEAEVKAYILNKKAYRHIKAYYPDGYKPSDNKTASLKVVG